MRLLPFKDQKNGLKGKLIYFYEKINTTNLTFYLNLHLPKSPYYDLQLP